jgi:hypothetical protein
LTSEGLAITAFRPGIFIGAAQIFRFCSADRSMS